MGPSRLFQLPNLNFSVVSIIADKQGRQISKPVTSIMYLKGFPCPLSPVVRRGRRLPSQQRHRAAEQLHHTSAAAPVQGADCKGGVIITLDE